MKIKYQTASNHLYWKEQFENEPSVKKLKATYKMMKDITVDHDARLDFKLVLNHLKTEIDNRTERDDRLTKSFSEFFPI